MLLEKDIKVGKVKFIKYLLFYILIFLLFSFYSIANTELEGKYTEIKILDKISSKNQLIKLKNQEELEFKGLSIKSFKCSNSEFDDNPEITAYIQVRDLTKKGKDNVFVFNGWMFSSSPSIAPFFLMILRI